MVLDRHLSWLTYTNPENPTNIRKGFRRPTFG